jgi:hypothetical protein
MAKETHGLWLPPSKKALVEELVEPPLGHQQAGAVTLKRRRCRSGRAHATRFAVGQDRGYLYESLRTSWFA